ncbi:MAG: DNA replication and repair protein RecF [Coriobacteriaceae bacterium]|nr:DNA replication and repair protein RecF [Coriobacteriaceae bacterium]
MGIAATELAVDSYRSFDEFTLALNRGTTILVGRNAVGKTNLIEALQLLTAGASFRRPSPSDLVKDGEGTARASLRLEGEGRVLDMGLEVVAGRRSFTRNGKRVRAGGIRGVLPSVLFCPDDLDMVKRSARVRRDALDSFGVQLNEKYAQLLSAYERTVEQRNNLLKEAPAPALLEAWDESLVQCGARLLAHRMALLERVRAHFIEIYRVIAPHEVPDVRYVPSVGELPAERDAIAEAFSRALRDARADELRRGVTLVGPHRDEILFTIDGRPARDFGSQGQQRSFVLAWKMAEVSVTRDILGRYPLLLLDDVMSELDAVRRESIMGFVAEGIQTVVTTTNLGYFSQDILDRAKVVHIGNV